MTRNYTYDSVGRPSRLDITIGTTDFWAQPQYDSLSGKIASVRHFSGYNTNYNYNATGYLSQVTDMTSGFVLWQADKRDAEGHLTQAEMAGGALQEQQGFDSQTGRMVSVEAANDNLADGNVANLAFHWDQIGEMDYRSDMSVGSGGTTEYFCYDALSRVTNYGHGNTDCHHGQPVAMGYDASGNITEKSDICGQTTCYSYNPGTHEVANIVSCSTCQVEGLPPGGQANFIYNSGGDLLCITTATQCGGAHQIRGVSWWSFDRPNQIQQGSNTLSFLYDPEDNRSTMTDQTGNVTTYLSYPEIGVMVERTTGSALAWRTYIMADGKMVGMRYTNTVQSNGSVGLNVAMNYFIRDNLDSVSVVTDANGNATNRYSFDAWGESRKPSNWNADPTGCTYDPQPPFVRGFIGQEHLPYGICLVNLNARMYDATIGRFLSADPTVESPYDPQDLNRFSYAGNDPLAFSDPSGLCFLGCFWHSPQFRTYAGIAVGALLSQWALPAIAGELGLGTGTYVTAGIQGLSGGASGFVSTGKLHGAFLGAAESVAFLKVGDALQNANLTGAEGMATKFVAHGMVGGLFSVAGHGHFGSGFLAAGFGTLADGVEFHIDDGAADFAGNLTVHALAGGVGATLGGGKFANGAETAAFAYLFNDLQHLNHTQQGAAAGATVGVAAAVGCTAGSAGVCSLAAPEIVVGTGLVGAVGGLISDTVESVYDWLNYANKAEPVSDADGPHSTWKEDPVTGQKTRVETWVPNPQNPSGWDSGGATDVTGRPHYDKATGQYIPAPHTHLPDGTTRPATPDEIPK